MTLTALILTDYHFLNKHAAFSHFFALNFPFQLLLHLCNFVVAPQPSSDCSFSAVRICFT